MVFITQMIYILDGLEAIYNQFEDVAIPLISTYGELLLRVRPGNNDYVESSIQKPYEIHLVKFNT